MPGPHNERTAEVFNADPQLKGTVTSMSPCTLAIGSSDTSIKSKSLIAPAKLIIA